MTGDNQRTQPAGPGRLRESAAPDGDSGLAPDENAF
jgi:hypothetical protein